MLTFSNQAKHLATSNLCRAILKLGSMVRSNLIRLTNSIFGRPALRHKLWRKTVSVDPSWIYFCYFPFAQTKRKLKHALLISRYPDWLRPVHTRNINGDFSCGFSGVINRTTDTVVKLEHGQNICEIAVCKIAVKSPLVHTCENFSCHRNRQKNRT